MRIKVLAVVCILLVGCVRVAAQDVLPDSARALLADIDQRGMTWEVRGQGGTIYPTWDDTGQMLTYDQWVTGYYHVWPEFVGGGFIAGGVVEARYVRLIQVDERDGWVVYAVVLSPVGFAASG